MLLDSLELQLRLTNYNDTLRSLDALERRMDSLANKYKGNLRVSGLDSAATELEKAATDGVKNLAQTTTKAQKDFIAQSSKAITSATPRLSREQHSALRDSLDDFYKTLERLQHAAIEQATNDMRSTLKGSAPTPKRPGQSRRPAGELNRGTAPKEQIAVKLTSGSATSNPEVESLRRELGRPVVAKVDESQLHALNDTIFQKITDWQLLHNALNKPVYAQIKIDSDSMRDALKNIKSQINITVDADTRRAYEARTAVSQRYVQAVEWIGAASVIEKAIRSSQKTTMAGHLGNIISAPFKAVAATGDKIVTGFFEEIGRGFASPARRMSQSIGDKIARIQEIIIDGLVGEDAMAVFTGELMRSGNIGKAGKAASDITSLSKAMDAYQKMTAVVTTPQRGYMTKLRKYNADLAKMVEKNIEDAYEELTAQGVPKAQQKSKVVGIQRTLEQLDPKFVDSFVLPLTKEFEGYLRVVQKSQSYRIMQKARQMSHSVEATLPVWDDAAIAASKQISEMFDGYLKRVRQTSSPQEVKTINQEFQEQLNAASPETAALISETFQEYANKLSHATTDIKAAEITEKFKAKLESTVPDIVNSLQETFKRLILVFGGRQFRDGKGGLDIASRLEGMFDSNTRLVGINNPEVDSTHKKTSEQMLAEASGLQKAALGLFLQFAPEIGGNREFYSTILSAIKLVTHSLDPTSVSQGAIEAVATALAAESFGVDVGMTSYSIGGATLIQALNALEMYGKRLQGLAMAYPHMGLLQGGTPSGFESAILDMDALTFGYQVGAPVGPGQHIIESDSYLMSYENHAEKHLFGVTSFLELLARKFGEMGVNVSDIVGKSAELKKYMHTFGSGAYEGLAHAIQAESLLKTGQFDVSSPFAATEGMNVVTAFAKTAESLAAAKSAKGVTPEQEAQRLKFIERVTPIVDALGQRLRDEGVQGMTNDPKQIFGFFKYLEEFPKIIANFKAIAGESLTPKEAERAWFVAAREDNNPSLIEARLASMDDAITYFDSLGKSMSKDFKGPLVDALKAIRGAMENFVKTGKFDSQNVQIARDYLGKESALPKPAQLQSDFVKWFSNVLEVEDLTDPRQARRVIGGQEVPEALYGMEASLKAYNVILDAMGSETAKIIPHIREFEKAAAGMSGAITLLTKDLAFKTDLDDPQSIATKEEIASYRKLQGRMSPRLVDFEPGQYLVTERVGGTPIKEILDKQIKSYDILAEQETALRKELEKEEGQFEPDTNKLKEIRGQLRQLKRSMALAKKFFNDIAAPLYEGIGSLGRTFQEMGVAHLDLASGNVFLTPEGMEKFQGIMSLQSAIYDARRNLNRDLQRQLQQQLEKDVEAFLDNLPDNMLAIDLGRATTDPSVVEQFHDYFITNQRAIIDSHFWGRMNIPKVVQSVTKGYMSPVPTAKVPPARPPMEVPTYADAQRIKLGSNQRSELDTYLDYRGLAEEIRREREAHKKAADAIENLVEEIRGWAPPDFAKPDPDWRQNIQSPADYSIWDDTFKPPEDPPGGALLPKLRPKLPGGGGAESALAQTEEAIKSLGMRTVAKFASVGSSLYKSAQEMENALAPLMGGQAAKTITTLALGGVASYGIGSGVSTGIETLSPEIGGQVVGAADTLADFLIKTVGTVTREGFELILKNLWMALESHYPVLGSVAEAGQTVAGGVSQVAGGAANIAMHIPGVAGGVAEVQAGFQIIIDAIVGFERDLVEGSILLKGGIDVMSYLLNKYLPAQIQEAIRGAKSLQEAMRNIGGQTPSEITKRAEAFDPMLPEGGGQLRLVPAQQIHLTGKQWEEFRKQYIQYVPAVNKAIKSVEELLKEDAPSEANIQETANVLQGIADSLPGMMLALSSLNLTGDKKAVQGLRRLKENLQGRMEQGVPNIQRQFEERFGPVASRANPEIVGGLSKGIQQHAGEFVAAMEQLGSDGAEAFKETIKRRLDIHSPSRFTTWIVEMMAAGINKGKSAVQAAYTSVVGIFQNKKEEIPIEIKATAKADTISLSEAVKSLILSEDSEALDFKQKFQEHLSPDAQSKVTRINPETNQSYLQEVFATVLDRLEALSVEVEMKISMDIADKAAQLFLSQVHSDIESILTVDNLDSFSVLNINKGLYNAATSKYEGFGLDRKSFEFPDWSQSFSMETLTQAFTQEFSELSLILKQLVLETLDNFWYKDEATLNADLNRNYNNLQGFSTYLLKHDKVDPHRYTPNEMYTAVSVFTHELVRFLKKMSIPADRKLSTEYLHQLIPKRITPQYSGQTSTDLGFKYDQQYIATEIHSLAAIENQIGDNRQLFEMAYGLVTRIQTIQDFLRVLSDGYVSADYLKQHHQELYGQPNAMYGIVQARTIDLDPYQKTGKVSSSDMVWAGETRPAGMVDYGKVAIELDYAALAEHITWTPLDSYKSRLDADLYTGSVRGAMPLYMPLTDALPTYHSDIYDNMHRPVRESRYKEFQLHNPEALQNLGKAILRVEVELHGTEHIAKLVEASHFLQPDTQIFDNVSGESFPAAFAQLSMNPIEAIDELKAGVKMSLPQAQRVFEELGNTSQSTIDTIKRVWGIASPSKVATQLIGWFAEGIKKGKSLVQNAYDSVVDIFSTKTEIASPTITIKEVLQQPSYNQRLETPSTVEQRFLEGNKHRKEEISQKFPEGIYSSFLSQVDEIFNLTAEIPNHIQNIDFVLYQITSAFEEYLTSLKVSNIDSYIPIDASHIRRLEEIAPDISRHRAKTTKTATELGFSDAPGLGRFRDVPNFTIPTKDISPEVITEKYALVTVMKDLTALLSVLKSGYKTADVKREKHLELYDSFDGMYGIIQGKTPEHDPFSSQVSSPYSQAWDDRGRALGRGEYGSIVVELDMQKILDSVVWSPIDSIGMRKSQLQQSQRKDLPDIQNELRGLYHAASELLPTLDFDAFQKMSQKVRPDDAQYLEAIVFGRGLESLADAITRVQFHLPSEDSDYYIRGGEGLHPRAGLPSTEISKQWQQVAEYIPNALLVDSRINMEGFGNNIAEGLDSELPKINSVFQKLQQSAQIGVDVIKRVWGISSPSKVAKELMESIADGAQAGVPKVTAAMSEIQKTLSVPMLEFDYLHTKPQDLQEFLDYSQKESEFLMYIHVIPDLIRIDGVKEVIQQQLLRTPFELGFGVRPDALEEFFKKEHQRRPGAGQLVATEGMSQRKIQDDYAFVTRLASLSSVERSLREGFTTFNPKEERHPEVFGQIHARYGVIIPRDYESSHATRDEYDRLGRPTGVNTYGTVAIELDYSKISQAMVWTHEDSLYSVRGADNFRDLFVDGSKALPAWDNDAYHSGMFKEFIVIGQALKNLAGAITRVQVAADSFNYTGKPAYHNRDEHQVESLWSTIGKKLPQAELVDEISGYYRAPTIDVTPITEGINQEIPQVQAAFEQLGQSSEAGLQAIKDVWGISSPSKESAKIIKNIALGLQEGSYDLTLMFESVLSQASQQGTSKLQETLKESLATVTTLLSEVQSKISHLYAEEAMQSPFEKIGHQVKKVQDKIFLSQFANYVSHDEIRTVAEGGLDSTAQPIQFLLNSLKTAQGLQTVFPEAQNPLIELQQYLEELQDSVNKGVEPIFLISNADEVSEDIKDVADQIESISDSVDRSDLWGDATIPPPPSTPPTSPQTPQSMGGALLPIELWPREVSEERLREDFAVLGEVAKDFQKEFSNLGIILPELEGVESVEEALKSLQSVILQTKKSKDALEESDFTGFDDFGQEVFDENAFNDARDQLVGMGILARQLFAALQSFPGIPNIFGNGGYPGGAGGVGVGGGGGSSQGGTGGVGGAGAVGNQVKKSFGDLDSYVAYGVEIFKAVFRGIKTGDYTVAGTLIQGLFNKVLTEASDLNIIDPDKLLGENLAKAFNTLTKEARVAFSYILGESDNFGQAFVNNIDAFLGTVDMRTLTDIFAIGAVTTAIATYAAFGRQLTEISLNAKLMQAQLDAFAAGNYLGNVYRQAQQLGARLQDMAELRFDLKGALLGTGREGDVDIIAAEFGKIEIAMGLTADQANRARLAISQMVAKGTIEAEELKRQLAEAGLPNAIGALARSQGESIPDLFRRMRAGEVPSSEVSALLTQLRMESERAYDEMAKQIPASMNRATNATTKLAVEMNALPFGILTEAARLWAGFLEILADNSEFLAAIMAGVLSAGAAAVLNQLYLLSVGATTLAAAKSKLAASSMAAAASQNIFAKAAGGAMLSMMGLLKVGKALIVGMLNPITLAILGLVAAFEAGRFALNNFGATTNKEFSNLINQLQGLSRLDDAKDLPVNRFGLEAEIPKTGNWVIDIWDTAAKVDPYHWLLKQAMPESLKRKYLMDGQEIAKMMEEGMTIGDLGFWDKIRFFFGTSNKEKQYVAEVSNLNNQMEAASQNAENMKKSLSDPKVLTSLEAVSDRIRRLQDYLIGLKLELQIKVTTGAPIGEVNTIEDYIEQTEESIKEHRKRLIQDVIGSDTIKIFDADTSKLVDVPISDLGDLEMYLDGMKRLRDQALDREDFATVRDSINPVIKDLEDLLNKARSYLRRNPLLIEIKRLEGKEAMLQQFTELEQDILTIFGSMNENFMWQPDFQVAQAKEELRIQEERLQKLDEILAKEQEIINRRMSGARGALESLVQDHTGQSIDIQDINLEQFYAISEAISQDDQLAGLQQYLPLLERLASLNNRVISQYREYAQTQAAAVAADRERIRALRDVADSMAQLEAFRGMNITLAQRDASLGRADVSRRQAIGEVSPTAAIRENFRVTQRLMNQEAFERKALIEGMKAQRNLLSESDIDQMRQIGIPIDETPERAAQWAAYLRQLNEKNEAAISGNVIAYMDALAKVGEIESQLAQTTEQYNQELAGGAIWFTQADIRGIQSSLRNLYLGIEDLQNRVKDSIDDMALEIMSIDLQADTLRIKNDITEATLGITGSLSREVFQGFADLMQQAVDAIVGSKQDALQNIRQIRDQRREMERSLRQLFDDIMTINDDLMSRFQIPNEVFMGNIHIDSPEELMGRMADALGNVDAEGVLGRPLHAFGQGLATTAQGAGANIRQNSYSIAEALGYGAEKIWGAVTGMGDPGGAMGGGGAPPVVQLDAGTRAALQMASGNDGGFQQIAGSVEGFNQWVRSMTDHAIFHAPPGSTMSLSHYPGLDQRGNIINLDPNSYVADPRPSIARPMTPGEHAANQQDKIQALINNLSSQGIRTQEAIRSYIRQGMQSGGGNRWGIDSGMLDSLIQHGISFFELGTRAYSSGGGMGMGSGGGFGGVPSEYKRHWPYSGPSPEEIVRRTIKNHELPKKLLKTPPTTNQKSPAHEYAPNQRSPMDALALPEGFGNDIFPKQGITVQDILNHQFGPEHNFTWTKEQGVVPIPPQNRYQTGVGDQFGTPMSTSPGNLSGMRQTIELFGGLLKVSPNEMASLMKTGQFGASLRQALFELGGEIAAGSTQLIQMIEQKDASQLRLRMEQIRSAMIGAQELAETTIRKLPELAHQLRMGFRALNDSIREMSLMFKQNTFEVELEQNQRQLTYKYEDTIEQLRVFRLQLEAIDELNPEEFQERFGDIIKELDNFDPNIGKLFRGEFQRIVDSQDYGALKELHAQLVAVAPQLANSINSVFQQGQQNLDEWARRTRQERTVSMMQGFGGQITETANLMPMSDISKRYTTAFVTYNQALLESNLRLEQFVQQMREAGRTSTEIEAFTKAFKDLDAIKLENLKSQVNVLAHDIKNAFKDSISGGLNKILDDIQRGELDIVEALRGMGLQFLKAIAQPGIDVISTGLSNLVTGQGWNGRGGGPDALEASMAQFAMMAEQMKADPHVPELRVEVAKNSESLIAQTKATFSLTESINALNGQTGEGGLFGKAPDGEKEWGFQESDTTLYNRVRPLSDAQRTIFGVQNTQVGGSDPTQELLSVMLNGSPIDLQSLNLELLSTQYLALIAMNTFQMAQGIQQLNFSTSGSGLMGGDVAGGSMFGTGLLGGAGDLDWGFAGESLTEMGAGFQGAGDAAQGLAGAIPGVISSFQSIFGGQEGGGNPVGGIFQLLQIGLSMFGKFGGGFKDGGSVGSAMAAERGAGKKPLLVVAHEGEEILSTLNGDAQAHRALKRSGLWESLKSNNTKGYLKGGTVGHAYKLPSRHKVIDPSYGQPAQEVTYQQTVTMHVNGVRDEESFRRSRTQLENRQRDAMSRSSRGNRLF